MSSPEEEGKKKQGFVEGLSGRFFKPLDGERKPRNLQEGEISEEMTPADSKNLQDMIKLIPQVRRVVPRSDAQSLERAMTEYTKSIQYSTLVILPASFAVFRMKFFKERLNPAASFVISIMSCSMLAIGNVIMFQPLINNARIERMVGISTNYKPIVRDQANIQYIQFARQLIGLHPFLLDDSMADKAYDIAVREQQLHKGKQQPYLSSAYYSSLTSLHREVNQVKAN